MPPVAVVDLGTNSTRLLVGKVDDRRVEELARRTNVTRLGEGVDASGRLADDAMERVFRVLGEYRAEIDRHRAEAVVGVATSAVRDSANGEDFRAELAERFAIDVRVISGEEEARLTFLGATAGRDPGAGTLVIDIGGGSTEYVVGNPGSAPGYNVSTRMGSVRHTERHLRGDPPDAGELEALRSDARAIVEAEVPAGVRSAVERGIAVAGTATSLAAVDQRLEPYDPERVQGYVVSREACERMLAELAALPVAERRQVAGLMPERAPTIVAGVAILAESMAAFGLASIEVSEADILHGVVLANTGEVGGLSQGCTG